ncbi:MAG: succinylglutamate desuccinylase/aspartoacylase family protein [Xanthomonadales bacterium]|nr:succinylglutamate desuccinylase/aspartoacylase family protein [Gammaproteobacteria bacterium]MBT8052910.1 succinylglutamate desuccinylase/aspartoacylase family protein [Gammaproteobacteria bacterium]NND56193.1 succinylglutamate desuccinylase/aspartoacylase family protein [Xanthomonadales bacterium]NNK51561.1 succinylglutamate desuccinylase/aspartoacylase family protein [Xanthomonadales bacterium]
MAANQAITIGDVVIKPGQRVNVNLPIANLYTATSLHMPVKVLCGRRAGPVLFVSAAIHGDELNGVEIIRRLLKRKALKSIRGTLLAIPIVNVHGFIDQSRYLPDRRDLNRSFPGSPKGSIAARLANIFLKEIVLKSGVGIDLHTGAIDRANLPQIRANLDDPRIPDLAEAFGAPVVVNATLRDGSLRACAAGHDIPVMIYEAGEALRFDELSIRAGIRGILGVMRQLGMLPPLKRKPATHVVTARATSWVRASTSGIVTGPVALGTRVKENDRLALISDPLGELEETIRAPFDGIVIGSSRLPLAHEGDALFHLADFRSVGRAEELVEEFAATHDPALRRTVEPNLLET